MAMSVSTKSVSPAAQSVTETSFTDYANWASSKISRLEEEVSRLENIYDLIRGYSSATDAKADPAIDEYALFSKLNTNDNRLAAVLDRLSLAVSNINSVIG